MCASACWLAVCTRDADTRTQYTRERAQIAEKKTVSPQDEQWLDYKTNLVNEHRVLEALESASEYEQGFVGLDEEQKAFVKRSRC